MKISGPLFKWFGSKWLSSKKLPAPRHKQIVEPFAGCAGYSLRHHEHDVTLYEADPHLHNLWKWLISEATQSSIRDIPIGVAEGTDIRALGLTPGQALLLKTWQRTNNVGDCWTISPWGNKPGQWTASTRARVSEEFAAIAHWKVGGQNGMHAFNHVPTTWFIDPPYEYNYQYRGKEKVDYKQLAASVRECQGQVIVCEAICQKTGAVPNWLPFEFWGSRITSRRKANENHHSKELLFSK